LYFARPGIDNGTLGKLRSLFGHRRTFRNSVEDLTNENRALRVRASVSNPRHDHLRNLAKRTLKGMCIMLLATVINLSILFHMSGQEREWMCFMFCSLDGKGSSAPACPKTILTVSCSDGWHSCLALCH
jgi:hypothetical protein